MKRTLFAGLMVIMVAMVCSSCRKTISCVDTTKITTAYCGTVYDPVCGCDNYTYQNSCEAQKRGVVQWIQGPCP